jgi:lipid II:glycine glycyltransferase (peptidoglycan interpeptide bridge formation enzyme)
MDGECFYSLFDEILRYGRKAGWKYLELRGGASRLNDAPPYQSYMRHVLSIQGGEEKLFRGLKKGTKSNVRKAMHEGVLTSVSDSERDLREYYRLHCMTRKRHGVPPQPLSFFKAVHRNVISKGNGFIVLAEIHGRPISGAVYFHSGKKAIYKYGATDLDYQHLRAGNLVMWEAIRWFSNKGFDELCLGRSEMDNAGLIHFKDGWGARQEPLHYFRYDLRRSAFVKGKPASNGLAERFFRRLPLPFLRIAGEVLYRHMG